MANYCCTIRTNYFRVKDPDAFREFMSRVYGDEDNVELFEKLDEEGRPMFGFGTYGGIGGVRNAEADEDDDADESSYDEFIEGLQANVAEDDAVIIFEAGHEKLRYITGIATVITSQKCTFLDITDMATKKAAELLGNSNWATTCCY